jgi:hypothetical protein
MARIEIVPFDHMKHGNPMWYVDDAQSKQHWRAPSLSSYKVCLVTVHGFTFMFHSVGQIELCLQYYSREHHPTSRLPVYTENLGGDHNETQRWFEKLPQFLLEKSKRSKVVAALRKALEEYSKIPGANTGFKPKPLYDWS